MANERNTSGKPVAVVIGATSKWQPDGRNTRLAHGKELGGEIVPVDSEHSAVFQCLRSGGPAEVARIVLPLNIYSSAYVTMNARLPPVILIFDPACI